jgi:hypothetical protein
MAPTVDGITISLDYTERCPVQYEKRLMKGAHNVNVRWRRQSTVSPSVWTWYFFAGFPVARVSLVTIRKSLCVDLT